MKKFLFYQIAVFLTFFSIGFQANAQKHVDLQMTMASPQNNAVIPYNDTAFIKIAIKNLGPDTLKISQDSLYYGDNIFTNIVSINWANLAPMDTAQFLVLWDYNDGAIEDDTEHVCIYFLPDFYTSYVDSNQTNDTACVTFILKGSGQSGIANQTSLLDKSRFQISPNPAHGKVFFDFHLLKTQKITLSLYDLIGRKIIQKEYQLPQGKQKKALDISQLHQGVYFVSMKTQNHQWVKKLIVY